MLNRRDFCGAVAATAGLVALPTIAEASDPFIASYMRQLRPLLPPGIEHITCDGSNQRTDLWPEIRESFRLPNGETFHHMVRASNSDWNDQTAARLARGTANVLNRRVAA